MKNIITNNIAKNYMNNIVILILILSVFCQTLRCHCLSLVCGIYTSVRQFIQFSSSQHDAEAEKIRKNKRKKKKEKKKDYSWLMKEEEPPSKEERV